MIHIDALPISNIFDTKIFWFMLFPAGPWTFVRALIELRPWAQNQCSVIYYLRPAILKVKHEMYSFQYKNETSKNVTELWFTIDLD